MAPEQFWLTIWKSAVSFGAPIAWICTALLPVLMLSGASPVFWTSSAVSVVVLAGTDVKLGGFASSVPTTAGPRPLRLVRLMSASVSVPPSCSWW